MTFEDQNLIVLKSKWRFCPILKNFPQGTLEILSSQDGMDEMKA